MVGNNRHEQDGIIRPQTEAVEVVVVVAGVGVVEEVTKIDLGNEIFFFLVII